MTELLVHRRTRAMVGRLIFLSGVESKGLHRPAADGYPLGLLAQPANGLHHNTWRYIAWGVDNGCFTAGDRFDLGAYLAYLSRLTSRSTCMFATAPDVLADPDATWARSAPVLPQIRALGYPAALVAQDGLNPRTLDWDAFDCLFMGGTTTYKLAHDATCLVAEARRRGKWCHMGRVNSLKRLTIATCAGYDSADGTYLKFAPAENMPKVLRWLDSLRGDDYYAGEEIA